MILFQLAIMVLFPFAFYSLARRDRQVFTLAPVIFVASWIAEASCIRLYGYYAYSQAWWWRVGGVPLLIPLIWPMIILSGRAVVRTLLPDLRRLSGAMFIIVFFDAAMIEVIGVNGRLWAWKDPGDLGVPLIGVLGWAFFAWAVIFLSERTKPVSRWLIILGSPLLVHAFLIAAWWLFFKWHGRGGWFALFLIVTAFMTYCAMRLRRRARIGWNVAWSRLLAAGVFIVFLLSLSGISWRVWLHIGLTSVPYALITDFSQKILAGKPR